MENKAPNSCWNVKMDNTDILKSLQSLKPIQATTWSISCQSLASSPPARVIRKNLSFRCTTIDQRSTHLNTSYTSLSNNLHHRILPFFLKNEHQRMFSSATFCGQLIACLLAVNACGDLGRLAKQPTPISEHAMKCWQH